MDNIFSRLWDKITGKNNEEDMVSEEKLISYKQNFTGQKFQWIKTPRPELIGKVVKCRDVQIQGNRLIAIFDDGSSIVADNLNKDLMMVHGDSQPLSKEEVQSLQRPRPSATTMEAPDGAKPLTHVAPTTPQPATAPAAEPRVFTPAVVATPAVNPFEMFNSDETDLAMKIRIKLPDKKLLKMMYNNAEDKAKFLNQLSDYVQKSLTRDIIQNSLTTVLDPKKPQKNTPAVVVEPQIKLTEIQDGE
jgi:hypothetical protein